MVFSECFKMLCFTFGSKELYLVSGKIENLRAVKMKKILETTRFESMSSCYFDRINSYETFVEEFFIGFFIFFDVEKNMVRIVTSEYIKKNVKKIDMNEKLFCLANLNSAVKGQEIFRAEGFCNNFNTILRKNNLQPFSKYF
jgi:hypothetical protein